MKRFPTTELLAGAVAAATLWALEDRAAAIAVTLGAVAVGAANRSVAAADGGAGRGRLLAVAIAACALAVGGAPDSFTVSKVATIAMTVTTLQGLNVVVGYSGQLVLAHVAFMGVGAYTVAITAGRHGWPLAASIVMAVTVAAIAGFLLSAPAVRLSGHYLAIASLSIAIVFGPVMKLDAIGGLTGGVQGLSFFDKSFAPPGWLDSLSVEQWHAVVALVIAAAACAVVASLAAAPLGAAIRAGRDSPPAAASVGIPVARLRTLSIVLSAALGGAAGAVYFLISNRFVSPDAFTLNLMIELLVALMVGGRATVVGPVLGALFLVFVYRDGVDRVTQDYEEGSAIALAVAFALCAAVIAVRTFASAPVGRRVILVAAASAGVGLAAFAAGTMLEGEFFPTALGNLLMGVLLIVAVLGLPEGIAGLRWSRPAMPVLVTTTTTATTPSLRLAASDGPISRRWEQP